MANLNVSEEKFNKVLADVETLIEDVSDLFDQDEIAKERISDIEKNPSIGKSEKELEDYLKQRGVKVD
ncbi:hypothetical protein HYX06_03165 [Candidatus Woesearchaeota archaeon]|nr:hypothetical protein [Candidatus Woesearchaeota archaeon]